MPRPSTAPTAPTNIRSSVFRSSCFVLSAMPSKLTMPSSPSSAVSSNSAGTSSSTKSDLSSRSSQSPHRPASLPQSSRSEGFSRTTSRTTTSSQGTNPRRMTQRPPSPPSMYVFDCAPPRKPKPNPYLRTRAQAIAESNGSPPPPPPPLFSFTFKSAKLPGKQKSTTSLEEEAPASKVEPLPTFDPSSTYAPSSRPHTARSDGDCSSRYSDDIIFSPVDANDADSTITTPSIHSTPSTSSSVSLSTPPRVPSPSPRQGKLWRTLGESITIDTVVRNRRASCAPTISSISTVTALGRSQVDSVYGSDGESSPIIFSPPTPGATPPQVSASDMIMQEDRAPHLSGDEEHDMLDSSAFMNWGRDFFAENHALTRVVSHKPIRRSRSFTPSDLAPVSPERQFASLSVAATKKPSLPSDSKLHQDKPKSRTYDARPATSHGFTENIRENGKRLLDISHGKSLSVSNSETPSRSLKLPFILPVPADTPFVGDIARDEPLIKVRRSEKRQGWSGEWNRENMQEVIKSLRNLK